MRPNLSARRIYPIPWVLRHFISDLALARLKKAGVDTKEIVVEGMGHGFQPTTPQQIAALGEIAGWLRGHLDVK